MLKFQCYLKRFLKLKKVDKSDLEKMSAPPPKKRLHFSSVEIEDPDSSSQGSPNATHHEFYLDAENTGLLLPF
jgi:hypothetical protein